GGERIDADHLAIDIGDVLAVAGAVGMSVGGAKCSTVVIISTAAVTEAQVQILIWPELQSAAVMVALTAAFVDAEQHARAASEGVAGWIAGVTLAQYVLISI